MNIAGFIGQAGTGKTTRIIQELESTIDTVQWTERNSILAITFMHGSKRRLASKLRIFERKGIQVECQTIDGMCLRIVQRYRRYLGISKAVQVSEFVGDDEMKENSREFQCGINAIRKCALELISFTTVQESIKSSFPIIVIDEFQDCDGLLLEFTKAIASIPYTLIAADDFQRLSKEMGDGPSVDWLRSSAELVELSTVHRTNNDRILNSAQALRNNKPFLNTVEIFPVSSTAIAAWRISANVTWKKWGLEGSTLAIISPTKIESDNFFRDTISRLKQPFPNSNLLGTNVHLEGQKDESITALIDQIPEWKSIPSVDLKVLQTWQTSESSILKRAGSRAKRLLDLRGESELSKQEFSEIIAKIGHTIKAHSSGNYESSKTALTVHQAKNREFDYVIVLWSYKNQGGSIYHRKLLYNAITRAKKDAIIIAQSNEKNGATDETLKLLNPNYHLRPPRKKAAKKSVAINVKRTK